MYKMWPKNKSKKEIKRRTDMPRFEEDDDLLFEYQRYVVSCSGVPEDYDTWVSTQYGETKKRSRKPKRDKHSGYE